jgi:hypothetical protein
MLPFVKVGRTSRVLPPIHRNAKFDPIGRRTLRALGKVDIVERFEMTQPRPEDYLEFLDRGTAPDIKIDSYLEQAFSEASIAFQLPQPVCPLALDKPGWETISSQLDLSSTSGYPHFKKQGDILDTIYHEAHQLGHFMKYKDPRDMKYPPCYLSAKPAKYDKISKTRKLRFIFEYPAAVKINEMRYTQPLYEAYHALPLEKRPILSGEEPSEMVRSYYLNHILHGHPIALKTDVSKFDIHCPRQLIDMAFSIIAHNIDFGGYPYSAYHSRRNWKQFQSLKHYFINTPIALWNGEIYRKSSAVPSGSGFTLLVNSIITRILINACLLKLGHPLSTDMKTTGDDASTGLHFPISLPELAAAALDYGFTLHPDKQVIKESATEDEAFKLLGYIGFPWNIRFDSKVIWENVYLTKNYVLTNDDHIARVYSLYRLAQHKDAEIDALWNYTLSTYSGGYLHGHQVIVKPSNIFTPVSNSPIRYGKLICNNSHYDYFSTLNSNIAGKPSKTRTSTTLKYYYAIAEKAARRFYFRNKDDIDRSTMDTKVKEIFAGALLDFGFQTIDQGWI